jgi:hypothetical protein
LPPPLPLKTRQSDVLEKQSHQIIKSFALDRLSQQAYVAALALTKPKKLWK